MELETVMDDSVDDGAVVVALLDGAPVVDDETDAIKVDTDTDTEAINVDVDGTRPDETERSPAWRRWRSTRAAGAGRRSMRISPLRANCASVDLCASRPPLPDANAIVHGNDRRRRMEQRMVIGSVLGRHAGLRLGRRLPGRGRVLCDGDGDGNHDDVGDRAREHKASDEVGMDLRESNIAVMVEVVFVERRT